MSRQRFHQAPSPKPGRTDIRAEIDGEQVCTLEVMAAPIRLAGAALRTAGIANVFTPEPHRRRGYASALMAHTHDILIEAGYSAAALFGIPGFYGQFGYATIGCDFTMEVDARAAAQATGAYRLRPARQTDLPDVARMHNAANGRLNGSVIRDPSTWIGLRKGSTILGTTGLWLAEDTVGQLAGYIAIREDPASAVVIDGGYRDPAVAPSLIAHAAAEAVRRQMETITFHLHPEFGLGAYVRRMETKLESVRGCDSGYMLRMLDQDAVLRAMEPALRARAEGYGREAPARLRVMTNLGTTNVELRTQGQERTVALPHERLAQLVFGYWSAEEVAAAEGVRIAPDDVPWLAALFPRGDAFCHWPDEY